MIGLRRLYYLIKALSLCCCILFIIQYLSSCCLVQVPLRPVTQGVKQTTNEVVEGQCDWVCMSGQGVTGS